MNIVEFPPELISLIMSYLSAYEIYILGKVCKTFRYFMTECERKDFYIKHCPSNIPLSKIRFPNTYRFYIHRTNKPSSFIDYIDIFEYNETDAFMRIPYMYSDIDYITIIDPHTRKRLKFDIFSEDDQIKKIQIGNHPNKRYVCSKFDPIIYYKPKQPRLICNGYMFEPRFIHIDKQIYLSTHYEKILEKIEDAIHIAEIASRNAKFYAIHAMCAEYEARKKLYKYNAMKCARYMETIQHFK